jgi:ABC-2 type transport system ATP-binding protein
MAESIITLDGLGKRFGSVQALTGLTLEIPGGPVGLLGPNGAGKSTLIKLLLGLLAPNEGRARIAGEDPTTRAGRLALRRSVGYMPEGDCLIPGMNAVEIVMALGRMAGMSKGDAMTRAHEVLDYVGLEESRYRKLDEYSTGMKQRLKLAQALVHDPALLLLDEPTNGLDPKGRRHMLELIHDLGHAQQKHVLLCSHLLPDVERTCGDVVVLHRGRALAQGSIAEMTRAEQRWMGVEVAEGDERAAAFARELEVATIGFERGENGTFRVRTAAEDGDRLFALAERSGATLVALTSVRSSLEDVFLRALAEAEDD